MRATAQTRGILVLRNVFVASVAILSFAGCGSYDSGYEDGYDGAKRKEWILFGRSEYNAGYDDGDFDADCDYWKRNDHEKYRRYCLR